MAEVDEMGGTGQGLNRVRFEYPLKEECDECIYVLFTPRFPHGIGYYCRLSPRCTYCGAKQIQELEVIAPLTFTCDGNTRRNTGPVTLERVVNPLASNEPGETSPWVKVALGEL